MTNPWLDRIEYPFTHRDTVIHGERLHFVDEGAGEPVLFVHGTPSWSFDFRKIISGLTDSYRCLATDHLGFGLSDKPAAADYSPQAHAARLEHFIVEKNLTNLTLAMHDFGGPIGMQVALRHPERIARLVILNSWLWNTEDDPAFRRMKPILKSPLLPWLYRQLNFSPRFLLPSSFGKHKLDRRLRTQYTAPFGKPAERNGTIAFARSLMADQAWFQSLWESRETLCAKPLLLIWGMADRFAGPSYLEKFKSGFPVTESVQFEECGHFPQEEESERVLHALKEWLERTSQVI